MQSSLSTSKKTIKEEAQEKLITSPHEYIRDSLHFRYKNCIFCGNRTEYTCIKCSYCYSCHWKREQFEEIEQRDNLKDFYISMSKVNDDNDQKKLQTEKKQVGG